MPVMQSKRILIVNAIPTNNGDAALVFGLYKRLLKDGHHIQIATFDYERISGLYGEKPIVMDILDHPILRSSRMIRKFQFMLLPFLFLFSTHYRKADLIIGVPGGYLNSFYMFSHKLFVHRIAKFLGKKTAIYSQSVGPLDIRGKKILKKYIPYLDVLMVRDKFSHDLVKELLSKDEFEKIIRTEDAAFLWKYHKRKTPYSKKVAVSVRSWNKDGRSSEHYRTLIRAFCLLVLKQGYDIEFLSTCQGLPNYVDDSKEAVKIMALLPREFIGNIHLNSEWYNVDELQTKLKEYNFVIGTRLHMCILSLLNDVPAFNISYEIKGLECYNYLNMKFYSVDYNEEVDRALEKLEVFIQEQATIAKLISEQIPKMNNKAEEHYFNFIRRLEI